MYLTCLIHCAIDDSQHILVLFDAINSYFYSAIALWICEFHNASPLINQQQIQKKKWL